MSRRDRWIDSRDADDYFEALAEAADGVRDARDEGQGQDAPVPTAGEISPAAGAPCGHAPAGTRGVSCDRPAGHAGLHGDRHEAWAD